MKEHEYVIIGAGICGCSVAYELLKHTNDILLIDKLPTSAEGASGAAGAFLSPLLGKPNDFKDLVTRALKYSTKLYKEKFPGQIDNCGTVRIPKNEQDRQKFETYKPHMDFPYKKEGDGYYFEIGSVVNSAAICKIMTDNPKLNTLFNYEVKSIEYKNGSWHIDDSIVCKKLILATGADVKLIDEEYIKLRPVWGYRCDLHTSTKLDHNYHKECSVSKSFPVDDNIYKVSIGATHNRTYEEVLDIEKNNEELLNKAKDIVKLDDPKVVRSYSGARASSVDYFPMVGKLIDSKKSLEEFPYLVNGTYVNPQRFTRYENLYILNGIGGRGFVLAPYLANMLVENIVNGKEIDEHVTVERLFKRYAKRIKI